MRDCRKDYKQAFDKVQRIVRAVIEDTGFWDKVDESPESQEARILRLEVWRFVKSQDGLPPVGLPAGRWITQARENLTTLLKRIGIAAPPNFAQKIKRTGLADNQIELPLFEAQALFPTIRQETIHQVKGQSIDAVLVLGSTRFWNSVVESIVNGKTSEDRRLAYVAMTRSRHLLVTALPASHFDAHADKWTAWGFRIL